MSIEALFYIMLVTGMVSELFFYFHENKYESNVKETVIPRIKEFAPENYEWEKELSYRKSRRDFHLFSSLFGFAATVAVFATGLFGIVMGKIAMTWTSLFWQGFFFAVFFVIVYTLWNIPFSWYSSFVIEEKFGFNRKTSLTFWKDQFLSLGIAIVLAPPLLGFINFLAGTPFGIPLIFITLILFSLSMSLIFPIFIMPLFYKIEPLDQGELRKDVEKLIQRTSLPVKGVYKADQSKRSSHANAMVTGLGRSKKVILFDTLLDSMKDSEVLAVLAHEFGHWSKKHIPRLVTAGIIEQAVLFVLVWFMWNSPFTSTVFGVEGMTLARLIIILFILSSLMTLVVSPLDSWLSRKFEFEADNFAVEHTKGSDFQGALSALATKDLVWIPPSPLSAAWFSSHPSIPERILNISEHEGSEQHSDK